MSQSTKELVQKCFFDLKSKHGFTCSLAEEELEENYMMVFDYEKNAIVFDDKRIDEIFAKGVEYGVYKGYDINKLILFCILHELGHYYIYEENKNAFNVKSEEEYIQMEINGIQKAKILVQPEMAHEFHLFNQHILQSYKLAFKENRIEDSKKEEKLNS